jgi:tetratricopeptide (TPR) repeat protein
MTEDEQGAQLFMAEAAYAESIVMSALGDLVACITSLEQSLELVPTYAPAILALGSIDYQLDDVEQGRRRLFSLLDLADHERPAEAPDLAEILDHAGDFLISRSDYRDGFELYQRAVARFPDAAALHQGLCLCAGHQGHHEVALAAAEAALALEPDNQELVNDMGWTLYERGEPDRALPFLQRAVELDPQDALAAENLRICREAFEEHT